MSTSESLTFRWWRMFVHLRLHALPALSPSRPASDATPFAMSFHASGTDAPFVVLMIGGRRPLRLTHSNSASRSVRCASAVQVMRADTAFLRLLPAVAVAVVAAAAAPCSCCFSSSSR